MDSSTIKQRLQHSYDRQAREREQFEKEAWKVAERARFLSVLRERRLNRLLEVGAGTGQDSLFFQENGMVVTAVDISSEMVRLCREKQLDARQMDMYNLDFPPDSFDAIWSLNCLLHVPKADFSQVLASIHRVLRRAGVFYLGVYGGPDSEGIWEGDSCEPKRFFSFHTDASIQKAIQRYFRIVSFRPVDYGHPFLHFQSIIVQKM
jgi:SAM-dependent methyltransferase